jgi:hypothetical protein
MSINTEKCMCGEQVSEQELFERLDEVLDSMFKVFLMQFS